MKKIIPNFFENFEKKTESEKFEVDLLETVLKFV